MAGVNGAKKNAPAVMLERLLFCSIKARSMHEAVAI
jgi:hypothetical protein